MINAELALPSRKVSNIQFRGNTRFLVLSSTILALLFASANTILFNFTVICMVDDVAVDTGVEEANSSTPGEPRELFDQNEKGMLYSAVAIGTLISCVIIMKLITTIGGRCTFVIYGLISGVATFLLPLAADYGVVAVIVTRVMQGIGNGMAFATIGYVSAAWSPLRASGVFLTALTSYNQLAPLFTMPLAGLFCTSSFGWPGIYYLQGVLTVCAYALFYVVYTDMPRLHRHVSDKELAQIEHKKSVVSLSDKNAPKIPYYEMLTDWSVLGTLAMCVGDFVCFNIFVLFAPVYLNKVLGLDIAETGIMSAVPYLGSLLVKVAIGPLSDNLTAISTKSSVRLFMALSQVPMTLCLLALAFLPPTWVAVGQGVYLIAIVTAAFNAVGYYKAVQLSCGAFTSTIMSWFAVIYSLIILVLPLVKTAVAGEDTPAQWRLLFVMGSAVCFVTMVVWFFTVQVDLRPWAQVVPQKPSISYYIQDIVDCDMNNNNNNNDGCKSSEAPTGKY